jgi:hypothetical protein
MPSHPGPFVQARLYPRPTAERTGKKRPTHSLPAPWPPSPPAPAPPSSPPPLRPSAEVHFARLPVPRRVIAGCRCPASRYSSPIPFLWPMFPATKRTAADDLVRIFVSGIEMPQIGGAASASGRRHWIVGSEGGGAD